MGINFDALGDVEHFEHISGDLLDLFKSREHTDVTFVVNGIRFPAHKVILSARCTYFRILLYGEMKEAYLGPDGEIPFPDTTPEAFELLLEYIYSGKVCLGDLKDDVSRTAPASFLKCVYVVNLSWHYGLVYAMLIVKVYTLSAPDRYLTLSVSPSHSSLKGHHG